MRAFFLLLLLAVPVAAEPPLAEKFLHAGQLALGEQTLERALASKPNDELRYGLGMIQLVQGVERLGQSLYEYGAKSEHAWLPFVRLPVPTNPEPNAITYKKFRAILDDFRRDLEKTEATFAKITEDDVKLTLRLADVKLDLDADGQPTDRFVDLLKRLLGGNLEFLAKNRDFRVSFDRGDVAWFRSYCHLLMGLADVMLAFDLEAEFQYGDSGIFPNVRPKFTGTDAARRELRREAGEKLRVAEPARLGRFREHLLMMPKLNRETWRFIRAETDNDFEWLPNPRQQSVIGLPVRDTMIDGWLTFLAEMEKVLEGKKLVPVQLLWPTEGRGLNLKTLLDDPPAAFDFAKVQRAGIDAKYLERGTAMDLGVVLGMVQLFDGSPAGMYMAYFN